MMTCPSCGAAELEVDLSVHHALSALAGCAVSKETPMRARRVGDTVLPPRSSHLVELCGHHCFCYAPTNHIADPNASPVPRRARKCRTCENIEANTRLADPPVRHPEGRP